MKKSIYSLTLASALLFSGCTTNNLESKIENKKEVKSNKFLTYSHDILTGIVPFYGIIRYTIEDFRNKKQK